MKKLETGKVESHTSSNIVNSISPIVLFFIKRSLKSADVTMYIITKFGFSCPDIFGYVSSKFEVGDNN